MESLVNSLSSVATILVVALGGLAVGTGAPRLFSKRRPRVTRRRHRR
jgi:hypothetical protein